MRLISVVINALGFWLGWTALAHADPITTALFGAAFASSFLGGVVTLAITTAISYGVSLLANALAPKTSAQSQAAVGVQGQLQVGGDTPLQFPLGPSASAGLRVYIGTWGASGDTPNAYLTQVFALSDVPVSGQPALWVTDQKCTINWGSTETAQGYPVEEYPNNVWVRWHDGSDTTADSLMLSQFGSDPNYPWDATMVGRGTAYAVVTVLWDRNLFNGVPEFLFELPSIPLYDIRKDSTAGGSGSHRWADPSTWEVSDNPIVQAYNVARCVYYGTEWVFGGQNWPAFRLPASSWMAGMNECDAAAALAGGGSEKAFRSGGMVTTDSTPAAVIAELLKSCSGQIAEVGGIYKVLVGAPGASVYSFTDNDIVVTQEQGYAPFPGLDSTSNAITATYSEPTAKWATNAAPPLYNPDYETADDDRRLPVGIDFPLCQSNTQVQRLMRNALADARRFRTHSHYLPPYAWLLEPLDTVDWTSTRNGYTAKDFLITSISGEPTFLQSVALKEIDPTDFDRNAATEEQSFSVGNLVTNRPAPQLVSGWTASPGSFLDDGGVARHPSITITASAHLSDIRALRVQVRLASSGALIFDGEVPYDPTESAPAWTLNGTFLADTAYQVRGKFLPFSGRVTRWSNEDESGTEGAWLDVTTPQVASIDRQDLASYLQAQIKYATDSIADLQENLAAISGVVQDQDGANYDDKRTVLVNIKSQIGAVNATITSVAETLTTQTSAAAALATAAQATANAGTATGLWKIETQSAPVGVTVKVGSYLSTDTSGTVTNAFETLEIAADGTSTKTVVCDIWQTLNAAATAGIIADNRTGNISMGSLV